MDGRDYVLPDDVLSLTKPVLAHRLLPSVEAAMSGRSTGAILDGIVASVPVPGRAAEPGLTSCARHSPV